MKRLAGLGCFLQLILFAIYAWISYVAVDYVTNYFGHDLPWLADVLIGILTFTLSFWIAIILWLVG